MSLAEQIKELRDTDTIVVNRPDNRSQRKAMIMTGLFLRRLVEQLGGEQNTFITQNITEINQAITQIINQIDGGGLDGIDGADAANVVPYIISFNSASVGHIGFIGTAAGAPWPASIPIAVSDTGDDSVETLYGQILKNLHDLGHHFYIRFEQYGNKANFAIYENDPDIHAFTYEGGIGTTQYDLVASSGIPQYNELYAFSFSYNGIDGQGVGDSGKFIVSGGVVWSGVDLDFDASLITYKYFGQIFTTPADQLSLAVGGSDPRFDVFVVDVPTNSVLVVSGIPAPDPLIPAIGEDQIFIQATLIGAGATTPTVTTDFVYRDNADWTTSTYTIGNPTPGSVDFESTNSPFEGALCIDSNVSRSTGLRFQRTGSIQLGTSDDQFSTLSFRIRFDIPLPQNRNLLASVWLNGSSVGSVVNFMPFGVDRNNTSDWQIVVIPTSVFGVAQIDRIQIRMDGGNNSQQVQYFLDFIVFSTGIGSPTQLSTITIEEDGSVVAARPRINFIAGDSVFIDVNDDPQGDRVNVQINSTGGVGVTLNNLVIGGVKDYIHPMETLDIPLNYQYNIFGALTIDGGVENSGQINFI